MNLQKKKNDWVRLAFLLIELGPQTPKQLAYHFSHVWPDRDRTSSSIAGLIRGKQRFGFERVYVNFEAIYSFNGELPQMSRATARRWREKINPLKGGYHGEEFQTLIGDSNLARLNR